MNILFFLFLITGSALGNDNLVYKDIKKGQHAPFSGKLFTNEAIAKIIADHELALKQCKINSDAEIARQKKDWEFKYKLLENKSDLEKKMYTKLIDNRDEFIKKSKPVEPNHFENFKFVSGILVGAGITIGIAYSLDNLHD